MPNIDDGTPIVVAALATTGSIVTAWLTSRASARKTREEMNERVSRIEKGDPRIGLDERVDEVEIVAKAAKNDAARALEIAGTASADLDQYIREDQMRRERASEVARQRGETLATKMDDLVRQVSEQGGKIEMLVRLEGRGESGGRRGR